jgi:ribosomal protein S18 acetylase RimI-like enzyme
VALNREAFVVRAAQSGDIEEIVRLCAAHAEYERAEYDPAGKADALRRMLFAPQPRLFCLVVERCNGKGLAGYASWSLEASTWNANHYAHMDCLYLDPDTRGQGIGKTLIARIAADAIAEGVTQVQWQTPAFNADAIRFYERLGTTRNDKIRFYLDLESMREMAMLANDDSGAADDREQRL